ncbi:unnamed protein product [Trichogramma brassicae]|uniref:DUF7041 domain-containing protein n=1 Tax=Trichogramma brassicae TaxID=86971 RepID=A0A6H5J2G1_9HYME|nr:unnamed protein product [Trichogramma brassicae]
MILTVLDPETISEVSDIIRAPPAQDKYTTLKDAIVARLTDSPDTQLHKLLGTIELGDKKPSQLLLQMRTLAGARASNDILRVRWLDLLPDSTRDGCSRSSKNQTIDELAAVADELHAVGPSVMATEVGRPRSRPASPGGAASSNSNSVGAQEIAELRAAIVQLTEITREALQRNRRLLDNQTSLSTSCQVGPAPQVHTISVAATGVPVGPCVDAYDAILAEFASDKARPGEMATIVDFPVQHRIVTSGQPVFARPRRLAGDRLAAAKAEFKKLLDRGIIRPSSSQWASPIASSCRSLETPGGSRATTACSTPVLNRIDTLCLSSRTCFKRASARVFRSWICTRRFYQRSRSQKKTSRRRPSRHLSASSSL